MSPILVASIAFGCIVGGALIGMMVGGRLPDHHQESSSKDVVRLAMAMVATMTALVLGLITASAKNSFDTEDAAVKHTAATILTLDRMLAGYGPETKPIRAAMHRLIATKVEQIWPEAAGAEVIAAPDAGSERIADDILALAPSSDAQRWYQSRALELSGEILQSRWVVFNGPGNSVQVIFLVVIICWLTVLFGSFALFAPRNATVIGALLICTLSVAASIFLILEMDDPFSGVMKISSAPMRYALSHIDQ
jgi:hypothetical protein